jgi:hypothetical protein
MLAAAKTECTVKLSTAVAPLPTRVPLDPTSTTPPFATPAVCSPPHAHSPRCCSGGRYERAHVKQRPGFPSSQQPCCIMAMSERESCVSVHVSSVPVGGLSRASARSVTRRCRSPPSVLRVPKYSYYINHRR